MMFDDSFDGKKTNLAFEFTFHNFVELCPDGCQENFSKQVQNICNNQQVSGVGKNFTLNIKGVLKTQDLDL